MKEITLGHYNFIPESLPAEGDVYIRLRPIDLITYWKRCGVLANFAAAFYAYTQDRPEGTANSLSTVFNELIENATKYSVKRKAEVVVHMMMYDSVIKMQIENLTTPVHFENFKVHFEKLLACEDLDSLYINLLANKDESSGESGIGLLLLMKDYPIKLGAKFETNGDEYRVILQAYYSLEP